ncbi:hypothetical protein GCM10010430_25550 [Kitasatospora cystarginea]|uniref:Uncharacterized protein n=1 Tax=Kitasatospora cystarginea TaxID=58350 RepID=A0ABN3DWN3_9ACTN
MPTAAGAPDGDGLASATFGEPVVAWPAVEVSAAEVASTTFEAPVESRPVTWLEAVWAIGADAASAAVAAASVDRSAGVVGLQPQSVNNAVAASAGSAKVRMDKLVITFVTRVGKAELACTGMLLTSSQQR